MYVKGILLIFYFFLFFSFSPNYLGNKFKKNNDSECNRKVKEIKI